MALKEIQSELSADPDLGGLFWRRKSTANWSIPESFRYTDSAFMATADRFM